jgi:hypothetical protein
MSDTIAAEKLAVIATIKEGIDIGVKNIGPILVNVLLWILTIWIPYLNVGTTIGLMVGIVSKASRGEAIPMTEIFDAKYRKYIGEFFLTSSLAGIGQVIGFMFFVIPGIVIGLAWSLAVLLVIDKGKNPTEALTVSNNCTYGYKWKMFGIIVLPCLAVFIVSLILNGLGAVTRNSGFMGFMSFLSALVWIFSIFIFIGLQASIYKQLTNEV